MRRPRRNHTAAFKAKVAIAALKGDETFEVPSVFRLPKGGFHATSFS